MEKRPLSISEIQTFLPHRYPFLLIDRIDDYLEWQSATGTKNVTINEPYFQGHFPDNPVMPGVLQIEAMAQVAAICGFKSSEHTYKNCALAGIDKAKFKRPVTPGDTLTLSVKLLKKRIGKNQAFLWFDGCATLGEETAALATFSATMW